MDSRSKKFKNLDPKWIRKNLDSKTLHILVLDFKILKIKTLYEYQEFPTPKCNSWFSIRKIKKPKPFLNIKNSQLLISKCNAWFWIKKI